MTVTGIIAEYNPFHLGHAYHLAEARRLTDADFLIVVMSGDFVQRGDPALFNKYLRAQMALENGADLVLELPVPFATAGGEDFAGGSVAILDKLGVVDSLVFGSESGEIEDILTLADLLENETEETGTLIRQGLKEGLSYPAAVCRAFLAAKNNDFPTVKDDRDYPEAASDSSDIQASSHRLEQLLSAPNNLLGVEYCRALKRRSSTIQPMTIKRLGDYHSSSPEESRHIPSMSMPMVPAKPSFAVSSMKTFTSASALRNFFREHDSSTAFEQIKSDIPESAFSLLKKEAGLSGPLFTDDFTDALFYRLLSESEETLTHYLDVSSDLAGRILNQLPDGRTYSELAESVKCKSYTRLRINRALVHCLLGITDEEMAAFKQNDYAGYARILGCRDSARPLLREISQHSSIPLLYRMKEDSLKLSGTDQRLLSRNNFAADLYRMTAQRKFGTVLPDEYSRKLIKISHTAPNLL